MTLNEWRTKEGYSYRGLAKKLGAGGATSVRRWCLPQSHKDRLIPNVMYMQRIVDVSQGAVMPNDFYLRREFDDATR
tara:strand:+ start:3291 stop:3521 length:231 start_codon:yes stop_codon:yes gene_type:complete